MKLFFLLLISFCFGQVTAQNRIYIKPIIENTSYVSHSRVKKIANADFQYKLERIIIHSGIDIGLIVGYSFNQGKSNLEVGIQQSMAGSGFYLHTTRYKQSAFSSTPYYSLEWYESAMATSGIKIPLRFTHRIFKHHIHIYKPTPFYLSCHAIGAIHYYHQYTDTVTRLRSKKTVISSPIKKTEYVIRANWLKSRTLLLEVGLGFELRKRDREWFTLGITYLRGFENLMVNKVHVTVTDTVANTRQDYHANAYGQGTALIVSISKKIILPFKFKKPHS